MLRVVYWRARARERHRLHASPAILQVRIRSKPAGARSSSCRRNQIGLQRRLGCRRLEEALELLAGRTAGTLLGRFRCALDRGDCRSIMAWNRQNIAPGRGSTHILRSAHVPSYGAQQGARRHDQDLRRVRRSTAHMMGHPVRVSLDSEFSVDLDPAWPMPRPRRRAGVSSATRETRSSATYVGARARPATSSRPASTGYRRESTISSWTRPTSRRHWNPDDATHIPQAVEDPRVVEARHVLQGGTAWPGCVSATRSATLETIRKTAEFDVSLVTGSLKMCRLRWHRCYRTGSPSFISAECAREHRRARLHDELVADRGMKPIDCRRTSCS